MAKNKISEWSSNPASNTDVGGIDINEGCAPSGINNAIREVMAQVKDMQAGLDSDNFTVGGNLSVNGSAAFSGGLTLNGQAGTTGQVMVSAGSGNTPTWGNAFVAGMIMLWSGSIASVPVGWLLCDGTNGTPNLQDRFVVGAGSTYAVNATGGSANAIVVSHTHGITDSGHVHTLSGTRAYNVSLNDIQMTTLAPNNTGQGSAVTSTSLQSATTGITVNSAGSSGTNANLPPYFSLAYIMKA